jgi:2-oxoglutarate dehydrogenase E1 component
MARQDANQAFLQTAFLYGANAGYIEDLHARYQQDPNAVDAEWQAFFGALKDDRQAVAQSACGASWQKPNWPIAQNGELVSALDGNWAEVERAVGDKIQAKAQAGGPRSRPPTCSRRRAIRSAP